jgi:hypothetical protein
MSQTVANEAQITADLIAEASAAAGGLSPALAASAIAKAAIQATKLVALSVALGKLVLELKELLFPSIRFFKAATVKELISTYCKSIGYTFQSSLLDNLPDITILPRPLIKGKKSIFNFKQNQLNQSFTKGYPTSSDGSISFVGGLLKAMETTFNARTKVREGVVELERRDFWKGQSSLQLTGSFTNQEDRINEYKLNTNDAFIRQYVSYLTDQSDIHTLDNFDFSASEKGSENVNQIDPDLNLLKGLQTKQIPFSQGIAKTEFSLIEKAALSLFTVIDELFNSDVSDVIKGRLGVLQISEQFYSNPKLLIQQNGKQPIDYLDKIGAPALSENYHAIDNIENNSFSIHDMPTEMSLKEFEQTVYQETVNIDGVNVDLLESTYNPYDRTAQLKFKKPDNWAIGKIVTKQIA